MGVVDSRVKPPDGSQGVNILLGQVVLSDMLSTWGKTGRPGWLRACLAANKAHIQKHGHAFIVRWKPRLRTPSYQVGRCNKIKDARELFNCKAGRERETFNWEKHRMMLDYLEN